MVMGDDRGSMEQVQEQWLWVMKRREINIMKGNYSMFDGTWEEKAFTEDSKGIINIWPPRCYSCSFCKREFKSAQALGGHMNVHRRDRARLKQSINHHHHNYHQSSVKSSSSSDHQNHDHDHHDFSSCPNSTNIVASRVSVLWSSSSGSVGKRASSVSDHDHDHNHIETSLSVGLNQDPATGFRKRSKITTASAVSTPQPIARGGCFVPSSSSSSNDKYGFIRASSTIKENLDLELRLGDPPKVKVQTLR